MAYAELDKEVNGSVEGIVKTNKGRKFIVDLHVRVCTVIHEHYVCELKYLYFVVKKTFSVFDLHVLDYPQNPVFGKNK